MPRGSKASLIWPEFGPVPRALFYLFNSLLPCMCLGLEWKRETKSLSGPHQAGFTVWAQPVQRAALIVICAIFQTVLTIGLATDSWNGLSPTHGRLAVLMRKVRDTFSEGKKIYVRK